MDSTAGIWTRACACCAGYAGADLQALCTDAVMAALRRSSPEILMDPRLEEGIPLTASSAGEAAACPLTRQRQPPGSSQSAQHPSTAAEDSRQAELHDNEGGDRQRTSEAPVAAVGLTQGASQLHNSLQASDQQISDERLQPVPGAALRQESASHAATAGPVTTQSDTGDPAESSSSQPKARADARDLTAPAKGFISSDHANAGVTPVTQPEGRLPTGATSALDALEVRACDWREALTSAPEACARRGSMAAMSAAAAQALPARLGRALLPACASALQVCCMLLTPSDEALCPGVGIEPVSAAYLCL